MDGGRKGGQRFKDRLARLLRPANYILRSPCSSSSATSTAFTAATPTTAVTMISTSSSTSTTAASYTTTGALLPLAQPFSAALNRLRHPPPERGRVNKDGCSSSRHSSRRHFKNVIDSGSVRTLSSNPYGFITTSDDEVEDDDEDAGYGDDDTETFLSSRSLLSTDSSVFYTSKQPPSNNKSHHHRCRRRRRPRRRRCRAAVSCVDTCGSGASEPGFRPLVVTTTITAAAAEEVRKGLAVVKRSRNPYGDFRESMVEVIVGRQVFGAVELERLLESYMSLNAPCLHPVILQAFSDIWVVLHGG